MRDKGGLRHYLGVIGRRKWVLVLSLVLIPGVTYALSKRESPLYQASAQVLIQQQDLAADLGNVSSGGPEEPTRFAQTQAQLAGVPLVQQRTEAALHLKPSFDGRMTVAPAANADFLVFTGTTSDSGLVSPFVNEYARQFTLYRRQVDSLAVASARAGVERRLVRLEQQGLGGSALHRSLEETDQRLRELAALQTSNAYLVRKATGATQIRPRPFRNTLLAVGLALVFGIGLAFLWETLDTRLRTTAEVAHILRLPLLARLPPPPRRLRRRRSLTMLAAPNGRAAEPFRVLRTSLEFANLERGARVIMVTAATHAEGKTTTVANLAVALARQGRGVVLVDLDLRRPKLQTLFGLEGRPGLTDIALGQVALDEALVRIPFDGVDEGGLVTARGPGSLRVLVSGPLPPDPGDFAGTRALGEIIGQLRDRSDFVLVDAPPMLGIGDALYLTALVDALIVVVRAKVVRRPVLSELARTLDNSPAIKLGFVLTGASSDKQYQLEDYGQTAPEYAVPVWEREGQRG